MQARVGFGRSIATVLAVAGFAILSYPAMCGSVPVNDNFADAQVIDNTSGIVNGNNGGATREPGEPGFYINPGGASVWYSWTAPTTEQYLFNTCGSTFNTLLGIYTGNKLTNLRLVALNDNNHLGACAQQSLVYFGAVAGTTYKIRVDGANGAQSDITLEWQTLGMPSGNDNFLDRVTLSGDSGSLNTQNMVASRELGEPFHGGVVGGASLWYQWTPQFPGVYSFSTCDSTVDSVLAVYTGTKLNRLQQIAANDNDSFPCSTNDGHSHVAFLATAGTPYIIAVDGVDGSRGAIKLSWASQGRSGIPDITPTAMKIKVGKSHGRLALSGNVLVQNMSVGASSPCECQVYFHDSLAVVGGIGTVTLPAIGGGETQLLKFKKLLLPAGTSPDLIGEILVNSNGAFMEADHYLGNNLGAVGPLGRH